MGRFSGIGKVETGGGGGLYFQPDKMKVKIETVKLIDAADTFSGNEVFVVTAEVLEAGNPANVVGTSPSQVVVRNSKYPGLYLKNIKEFLGAALLASGDFTAEELADKGFDWEEAAEAAVGVDQPFAGLELGLVTHHKETQAGRNFTIHTWKVPGEE